MRLNADFDQRVVVLPGDYEWVPTPVPGVPRMMLDRIGGEVARATSVVRYDPDSEFPPHWHDGGEEILVLEGEFADEHGGYPAGQAAIRQPAVCRYLASGDNQSSPVRRKGRRGAPVVPPVIGLSV
jgi:anti-sigma factor ChrR (cupin superfamily)